MTAALQEYTFVNYSPGIYTDISMEEYNAIPYVRASGIKDMQVSIGEYWHNHINPEREQKQTDATAFGTALHMYILEPEKFAETYVIKPDGMSFATKEGKAWKACNADKVVLKEEDMRHIKYLQRCVYLAGAMPYLEGQKEITLIWDEESRHGKVRCKARVDNLGKDFALDIKTFSNSQKKPIERCVAMASANYGYHISAPFYARAVKAHNLNAEMLYLFIDTGGAPNVLLRRHGEDAYGMPNQYWDAANIFIDRSLDLHAACMQRYGTDRPWIDKVYPESFSDNDFPLYMTEALQHV